MFNYELKPFAKFLDALNSSCRNLNVIGVNFGRRNGSWQHQPFYEKSASGQSLAIATNTIFTVATVTAGQVPIIGFAQVGGSVAGRYEIGYGAVVFFTGHLAANTSVIVPIGGLGFLPSAVTGVALFVRQQTGGAADLTGSFLWAEVVP